MSNSNDHADKFQTILSILLAKINYFWGTQILISTKCSTGCRHCIYGDLKKEDMTKETIEKGLDVFKRIKIPRILISGGEPFEAYNNLLFTAKKLLEFLSSKRVFLITSANWAIDKEIVKKKLDPLIEIGLKNFSISCDAFHMKSINPDNYFLLLDYFKKIKMKPTILVRYSHRLKNYFEIFERMKNEYDANIHINVVTREGSALYLSEREIMVDRKDFSNFKKRFGKNDSRVIDILKDPIYNILTILTRTTCISPTLFPNGDLSLCCRYKENTKICNINTDDFYQSLKEFNKNCKKNIKKVLSQEISCEKCPISTRSTGEIK